MSINMNLTSVDYSYDKSVRSRTKNLFDYPYDDLLALDKYDLNLEAFRPPKMSENIHFSEWIDDTLFSTSGDRSPSPEIKPPPHPLKLSRWTKSQKILAKIEKLTKRLRDIVPNFITRDTYDPCVKFLMLCDLSGNVVFSKMQIFSTKTNFPNLLSDLVVTLCREVMFNLQRSQNEMKECFSCYEASLRERKHVNMQLVERAYEFRTQGLFKDRNDVRPVELLTMSLAEAKKKFDECYEHRADVLVQANSITYELSVMMDWVGKFSTRDLSVCETFPNCGDDTIFCYFCCRCTKISKYVYAYGGVPKLYVYMTNRYKTSVYTRDVVTDVGFPNSLRQYILESVRPFYTQMNFFPKIDVSDRVYDAYEEFSKKLDDIMLTIKEFDFKDKVNDLDNFLTDKKKFFIVPCSLMFAYNLVNLSSEFGYQNMLYATISGLMLKTVLPDDLCEFVKKLFEKKDPEVFKTQANFSQNEVMSWLVGVFSFLVIGSEYKSVFGKSRVGIVGQVPKFFEGVKFTLENIGELIVKLVRFIKVYVLGHDDIEKAISGIEEFDIWQDEVAKITTEFNGQILKYDLDSFWHVCKIRGIGEQFVLKFKGKDYAEMRTYVILLLKNLLKVQDSFKNYDIFGEGSRMVPMTALISGPPGNGKSNIMHLLAFDLLNRCIPDELRSIFERNHELLIHSRQAENVYWDGYSPLSFLTIFDDFGQMKDVPGQPDNEFMNLIRCSNCFPAHLHMSAVEQKSSTCFKSEIIICNSNMKTFKPNSIWFSEALERRFHVAYKMYIRPEYALNAAAEDHLRRLDIEKVKSAIDLDAAEFVRFSVKTGLDYGVKMSYQDVVDEMVSKHSELKEHHRKKCEILMGRAFTTQGRFMESRTVKKGPCVTKLNEKIEEGDIKANKMLAMIVDVVSQAQAEGVMLSIEQTCSAHWDDINQILQADDTEFDVLILEFRSFLLNNKFDKELVVNVEKIDYVKYSSEKLAALKAGLVSTLNKYPLIKVVGFLATTIGSVMLLRGLFTPAKQHSDTFNSESVGDKGRTKNQKEKNGKYKEWLQSKSNAFTCKGGFDTNMENIIEKVISKNHYTMFHSDGTRIGFSTFVKGRLMMLPNHYISSFLVHETMEVIFEKCGSKKRFIIKSDELLALKRVDFETNDCTIIEMPKIFPIHADISKFFVCDSMFDRLAKASVVLHVNDEKNVCRNISIASVVKDIPNYHEDSDEIRQLSTAIKYNAVTRRGDCGSILFLNDIGSGNAKIIGMHVAGNDYHMSLSNIITEEALQKAFKTFPDDKLVTEEMFVKQCNVKFDGFDVIGKTDLSSSISIKSRLTQTACYGAWSVPTTKPAYLTKFKNEDGIVIDPMEKARSKYSYDVYHIPRKEIVGCMDHVFKTITDSMNLVGVKHKRVMTFEEAIIGIPGEVFFEAIPRGTSAGYPYCEVECKGTKGKEYFFGSEEKYDLQNDRVAALRQEVDEIIRKYAKGEMPSVIFKDFLKDERRPCEKVELGKSRLVSGAPLAYVIAFRMYFLGFMANFMRSRIHSGSAVGVNPYSSEWDEVVKYLKEVGEDFVAGDYAHFDGNNHPEIDNVACEFINNWYDGTDNESTIRMNMFYSLEFSLHILGDIIYSWSGSLPSGHPITTIVNTITNMFLFRYVWVKSHFGDLNSLKYFNENVRLMCYGDDNVACIRKIALDTFNQHTITEVLSTIGFEYTDETKGSVKVSKSRNLNEISFLKRSFRFDNTLNRYVAPLESTVIHEIPYWARSKKNVLDQMYVNIDQSLREASLHGEKFYTEFSGKVKKAFSDMPYEPPYINHYEEILRQTVNQEFLL